MENVFRGSGIAMVLMSVEIARTNVTVLAVSGSLRVLSYTKEVLKID